MARKSRWGTRPEPPRATTPEVFDAWIYGRLSVEKSRSEDSIEAQVDYCKEYIASQHDLSYRGSFEDCGFTGTNFNRPQFSDMMAAILAGEVNCVVVKDLSRLGRTYIEVGELLFDTFLQLGVRFISVNDNYDSFAPDAGRKKLLILVKNLKNSQYSRDIAQKIKSVVTLNQKNGILNGGVPPYGYWLTDDRQGYQIVPEAVETVRLVFDLYADGMGAGSIANRFNAESRPTPRYHYYLLGLQKESRKTKCQTWMPNTVLSILENETYTGCLVQGKSETLADGKRVAVPREKWIVHRDKHPAIICNELFFAVQQRLGEMGKGFERTGVSTALNIFVGKVFCSRCGRALAFHPHTNKANGNKTYPTYECKYCLPELKREAGISGKSMTLRFSTLEALVSREIACRIDACVEIDALLDEIAASAPIEQRRRILLGRLDKLKKESAKTGELLTAAYTHHLSGLLDENEFNAVRAKFESDKQRAQNELASVSRQLVGYDTEKARESDCLIHFRKHRGFEKLDKTIIGAFVKRIEITPFTNEVSMTLNFADSFDSLTRLLVESGVKDDVC